MIAVISHDAGGAEILSSYVRDHSLVCCFVLEGPARKIFESKLGVIEIILLSEAISQCESILCSTSWQSNIEFDAIKLARACGKRSVAFLDHWVNYLERFIRSDEMLLPDEIWVGDTIALELASKIFPSTPIMLVENPYLKDVQRDIRALKIGQKPASDSITLLYVCEPTSALALLRHNDARYWGYVEEDALRYFLSNIWALGQPIELILIRPHPSERFDKYAWAQYEFTLPIQYGGTRSLVEEIARSDVIVGCESMAMVVALLANKKVISCIPPDGRPCVLPHTDITSFQAILKKANL